VSCARAAARRLRGAGLQAEGRRAEGLQAVGCSYSRQQGSRPLATTGPLGTVGQRTWQKCRLRLTSGGPAPRCAPPAPPLFEFEFERGLQTELPWLWLLPPLLRRCCKWLRMACGY
jgi:hypothetical protein